MGGFFEFLRCFSSVMGDLFGLCTNFLAPCGARDANLFSLTLFFSSFALSFSVASLLRKCTPRFLSASHYLSQSLRSFAPHASFFLGFALSFSVASLLRKIGCASEKQSNLLCFSFSTQPRFGPTASCRPPLGFVEKIKRVLFCSPLCLHYLCPPIIQGILISL